MYQFQGRKDKNLRLEGSKMRENVFTHTQDKVSVGLEC